MMARSKDQEILQKHKHKQLLALHKKILTAVSKMNLLNLRVDVCAKLGMGSVEVYITVFNRHSDNITFALYDFYDLDRVEKAIEIIIPAIRKDDFEGIMNADLQI